MAANLLELWKTQPSLIEGKSFRQIIQFAGEGRLRDGNLASQEIRAWLAAVPLETLRAHAGECLNSPFDDSGFALQDIVNEVGVRLGFVVQPGLYRGMPKTPGHDGLWKAPDEHRHIVEVKTNDAYRINLDIIADYRQALITDKIVTPEHSSILIAVGRQDTGDLEAQIRGSRHAWDVRLISIDSLFTLAAIKEQLSDWTTSTQINQLLRPLEYTKLDGIVNLLFLTSRDIEEQDTSDAPEDIEQSAIQHPTTPLILQRVREDAFERAAHKLGVTLVKKGRVLRSTHDGSINLVGLASKQYTESGDYTIYWYGFSPAHRAYLLNAPSGYLVLSCVDSRKVLLIDRNTFFSLLPKLGTTPPQPKNDSDIKHWHLKLYECGNKVELPLLSPNPRCDLTSFVLKNDGA